MFDKEPAAVFAAGFFVYLAMFSCLFLGVLHRGTNVYLPFLPILHFAGKRH